MLTTYCVSNISGKTIYFTMLIILILILLKFWITIAISCILWGTVQYFKDILSIKQLLHTVLWATEPNISSICFFLSLIPTLWNSYFPVSNNLIFRFIMSINLYQDTFNVKNECNDMVFVFLCLVYLILKNHYIMVIWHRKKEKNGAKTRDCRWYYSIQADWFRMCMFKNKRMFQF